MEPNNKRNWVFYLLLFIMFAVAELMVGLFIDKHELRHSIISGLVGGVIFTALWWIFVRIKWRANENDADHRRKEQDK
ncbi:MAG: hypothetical protein K5650_03910 [Bacteroidales bacterium]|nr:hypothetical protein [Bacteroidales bacterium]